MPAVGVSARKEEEKNQIHDKSITDTAEKIFYYCCYYYYLLIYFLTKTAIILFYRHAALTHSLTRRAMRVAE